LGCPVFWKYQHRNKLEKIKLQYVLSEWNSVVSASGSRTGGALVGHVTAMRAELERLRAERGMEWRRSDDSLPATEPLKQVKVLFFSPGWACPVYGMYTHADEGSAWSEYDQQNDRFGECEGAAPTYWAEVLMPAL